MEGETRETKEQTKRSQRPPKPLTHKMDKRALQSAYYKSGLVRPELSKGPRRSDKKDAKKRHASTRSQEIKKMPPIDGTPGQEQQPGVGTKPNVPGTGKARQEESFNMKCAKGGGTAFITGVALMLTHKLIGRWL